MVWRRNLPASPSPFPPLSPRFVLVKLVAVVRSLCRVLLLREPLQDPEPIYAHSGRGRKGKETNLKERGRADTNPQSHHHREGGERDPGGRGGSCAVGSFRPSREAAGYNFQNEANNAPSLTEHLFHFFVQHHRTARKKATLKQIPLWLRWCSVVPRITTASFANAHPFFLAQ